MLTTRGAACRGKSWQDSGYVFIVEDGTPLHPDYLTRRFCHLVLESCLPPVRLHGLWHGAASLAHCAGVDLKAVQAQLGHGSTVFTADTYASVLTDLLAYAAEAAARLVLAAAARNPGSRHRGKRPPGEIGWAGRNGPAETARHQAVQPSKGRETTSPTRVPPTSHKVQSRTAQGLYGLMKNGAPHRT